ncbi:hypothetical protein ACEF17_10405 [Streptococcus hyovaginalis]
MNGRLGVDRIEFSKLEEIKEGTIKKKEKPRGKRKSSVIKKKKSLLKHNFKN